jgi:hypothetical protein
VVDGRAPSMRRMLRCEQCRVAALTQALGVVDRQVSDAHRRADFANPRQALELESRSIASASAPLSRGALITCSDHLPPPNTRKPATAAAGWRPRPQPAYRCFFQQAS